MFLLCNIYDNVHNEQFPAALGQFPAIFDLSQEQMRWEMNSDWKNIEVGAIVCVVSSDRCFTTLYVVREKSLDKLTGASVLRGEIVAKPVDFRNYTTVLNANNVRCSQLPNNLFYKRFNVADLGEGMDLAKAKINKRIPELASIRVSCLSIGELKKVFKG